MKKEYRISTNDANKPKIYTLSTNLFTYRYGDVFMEWDLKDIRVMHLQFKPGSFKKNRYTCCLTHFSGENLVISNHESNDMYSTKADNENYSQLINDLYECLDKNNQNVIFKGGSSWSYYYNKLAAYIGLIVFFILTGILFISLITVFSILCLVLLILMMPIMIKDLKTTKPVVFTGKPIPELLLPKS